MGQYQTDILPDPTRIHWSWAWTQFLEIVILQQEPHKPVQKMKNDRIGIMSMF